eukprot:s808_g1.t1
MAPKKVMKAMKLKPKTLMKGPKAKAKSSSSKQAPGKGQEALMKGKRSKLTKAQLEKLGKFSLKEKVEQATANAETAEEAAQNLKDIVKPNERGQIWSKHQIAMKGDKEAQEEHNALNKTQKGLASLLWFVENQSKKFYNSSATFGTKHTLIKGDTWKTEKQMEAHFMKEWGKGGHHMLHDAETTLSKSGKASGSKGAKGGKGKKALLALTNGDEEDKDKDEKEDENKEWSKCLVKAQKAKEGCILAISNMEEALSSCQKAGRLTKAARNDYEGFIKEVQGQAEKLKKLLKLKQSQYSLEDAKNIIVQAANKTKELKDETKECVGLANKASSKASTKR